MPNEHEPLKPDPDWHQVNTKYWQSTAVSGHIDFPPHAYAKGFEDGAFALAEVAWSMIGEQKLRELIDLLSTYANTRTAHPARGWKNAPPR